MSFITVADLTGIVNISQSRYANLDYNIVIANVEESILKRLLGEDLYLKLLADLDGNGVPQTQKYKDLVDGVTYEVLNSRDQVVNIEYKGIKEMLKYFAHAELLLAQDTQNTMVGQVSPDQINSVRLAKNQLNRIVSASYNKGVALYGIDIQEYAHGSTDSISLLNSEYYDKLLVGNCFNFLFKNSSDYPTWTFRELKFKLYNGWL